VLVLFAVDWCDVFLYVQLVRSRVIHCSFLITVCSTTFMIRSCAHHTAHGTTRQQHHVPTAACHFAASQCCSRVASTDSAEWSLSAVLTVQLVPPVSFHTTLFTALFTRLSTN